MVIVRTTDGMRYIYKTGEMTMNERGLLIKNGNKVIAEFYHPHIVCFEVKEERK